MPLTISMLSHSLISSTFNNVYFKFDGALDSLKTSAISLNQTFKILERLYLQKVLDCKETCQTATDRTLNQLSVPRSSPTVEASGKSVHLKFT